MKKIFSKEPVNRGRQIELDIAKCLAIIFMIFLHTLMVTSGFANNISVPMQRGIQQLFGGPFAAPVFMFAMGVGFVYSRNQNSNIIRSLYDIRQFTSNLNYSLKKL